MMFGPSDAESVNNAQYAAWRIKLFSNDELRQKMVDQTVPQVVSLGLTVPDPDLRFNEETQHYEFGAIDLNEFNRILKGNGPATACARVSRPTTTASGSAMPWWRMPTNKNVVRRWRNLPLE